MRKSLKYCLGAAALTLAGACVAEAASPLPHVMVIDLPDGSVAQVRYAGDVAPKVEVAPAAEAAPVMAGAMAVDPLFAHFEAISAMMDAHAEAMARQADAMLHEAVADAGGASPAVAAAGTGAMPASVHFSYVSTSTDARGCTRTVSYASDGTGAAPKVTQAASDGCDAVKPGAGAIPAKAEAPAKAQESVGHKA